MKMLDRKAARVVKYEKETFGPISGKHILPTWAQLHRTESSKHHYAAENCYLV